MKRSSNVFSFRRGSMNVLRTCKEMYAKRFHIPVNMQRLARAKLQQGHFGATCISEGPYYIIPDRGEECPRSEMALDFPVKVKLVRERDNPNYFFATVNWVAGFVFDDTKDAHVVMASWGSRGGWKDNALIMKFKKLCTTIKTHVPGIWNKIVAHMQSNITGMVRDCPFPPASFSIQNLSTSVLQPKGIPYLFYGKWKIDVKAVEPSDDRVLGCFRIYASVIPKTVQQGKQESG